MEDFYYAGGLPAVIRALVQRNLIHCDALTVNGNTIWENCQAAPNWNPEVIRPLERPLVERGGIVVLRGNLAQDGAVLKPSAASPHLIGIADALWYSRISNTTRSGSTTPTWKSTRIAFSY
jgi:dihydroxyacid dehydratase/phosphogluconate dehydratase